MVNKIGLPIKALEDVLFTLKDILYTPETPKMNQPFTVKGKVDLFKIPFMAPCWIIVTVTYPEKWWEEIIPIWGSPEKREMSMAVGGEFEVKFARGFDREGEFGLAVRVYAGPTMPINAITLPPVPAAATYETTFIVSGEIPEDEEIPVGFRFSSITVDGNLIELVNKDADAGLLLEKTTADTLKVTPAFEWIGPKKAITISIKAGYKDWTGDFTPKTGAYTRSITLPESPDVPYSGELETPISIPLTACGGLTDGAIEVVAKIAGEPDYISRIWNVYATKPPEEEIPRELNVTSLSLS